MAECGIWCSEDTEQLPCPSLLESSGQGLNHHQEQGTLQPHRDSDEASVKLYKTVNKYNPLVSFSSVSSENIGKILQKEIVNQEICFTLQT